MSPSSLVEQLLRQEKEKSDLDRLQFRKASKQDTAVFQNTIGDSAYQSLIEHKGTEIFVKEFPNRMEKIYLIKLLDRAVELVFPLSPHNELGHTAELNFAYWNEYLESKITAFLTSNTEMQSNSLAFIHALKNFLEQVKDELKVVIAGSEAQRARLWERQVQSLHSHGHTNITFRKKV